MKKMKIVFLAKNTALYDELWKPKAANIIDNYNFDVTVAFCADKQIDNAAKTALKDCEAIITGWGSPFITADFIKQHTPKLRIIGHAAGSVANIADKSIYSSDVKIISANQIMAFGVAEWSLFATLCAARNPGCCTAWYGLSKMDFNPEQAFDMRDIRNMTIGIWGMGDTSKHLLKMLQPLCPKRILVVSEHSSTETIAGYGAEKIDFTTMLRESDMIHALVGLIENNYERFGQEEFAAMKAGATFVNGGRAHLANEDALIAALKSKHINAVLDVYHIEPLPDDSPLYGLDNVIMTPHNAGFVGRERFIPFLLEEFDNFFAGKTIDSEISLARFKSMTDENLLFKIKK